MAIRAKAFYRALTAIVAGIIAPHFASAAGPTAVNPSVWWKSDAGVTSSGGLVSSWADQSGNGNNAVNATSGQQPSLISNAVAGKPALRFDGIDDSLISVTGALTGNTPHTIFLVSKFTSASAFAGGAVLYSGTAGGNQNSTLGSQKDGRLWVGGYGEDDATPYSNSAGDLASNVGTTQFRLTEKLYSAGNFKGYLDGVKVIDGNGATYNLGNTETGVGRQFDTGTYYAGDIAEVLIYNTALSDSDRTAVEAYIAGRYLPEPSTTVLAGVAGIGMLARRRRRVS